MGRMPMPKVQFKRNGLLDNVEYKQLDVQNGVIVSNNAQLIIKED
jgi:hypothetical protein